MKKKGIVFLVVFVILSFIFLLIIGIQKKHIEKYEEQEKKINVLHKNINNLQNMYDRFNESQLEIDKLDKNKNSLSNQVNKLKNDIILVQEQIDSI